MQNRSICLPPSKLHKSLGSAPTLTARLSSWGDDIHFTSCQPPARSNFVPSNLTTRTQSTSIYLRRRRANFYTKETFALEAPRYPHGLRNNVVIKMLTPNDTAPPEDAETLAVVGKDIDSFLSKEMASLSFQQRNLMQEEFHGVASMEVEETPELIHSSLQKLEEEIQKIPDKPAYDKALELDGGNYVKGQDFRLMFLRAVLFDIPKAAKRLVAYTRLLFKYYGEKGLQRPLRYDDLSREEQGLIRAGYMQVVPQRDRSGRSINFHHGLNEQGQTTENRVSCIAG